MILLWTGLALAQFALAQAGHPCNRKCDENTQAMTCTFYLSADVYYVNQPDCLDCVAGNATSCQNKYCIPADGRFRMVKAYNFSVPGPTLEVCEHDTVVVHLKNYMHTETTSIHWHGIHQKHTQEMDGVPMVTQRHIQPSERFTYKFKAFPAGTHFYHSHSGSQRADGMYAKLIVRDYDVVRSVQYDEDVHSMIFADWFPMLTEDVTMRYHRSGLFYNNEPKKSLLIDSRAHNKDYRLPPMVYEVQQGKRYRFRMIHAGNIVCPIEVTIDNHTLLAFNSDGHNFKPVAVDSITLSNAERYDFVLNANQTVGEYVIRINSYLTCNVKAYAILRYVDPAEPTPTTTKPIDYDKVVQPYTRLNCIVERTPGCLYYTNLTFDPRVVTETNAPELPRDLCSKHYTYSLFFDQYFNQTERFRGPISSPRVVMPYINEIAYKPPKKSMLCADDVKNYCNEFTIEEPFSECTHVVEIPADKVIELVLIDQGRVPHPIHLHGYSFMVVSQGKLGATTTRAEVMEKYYKNELYRNKDPIMKDVVSVPDGGYAVIRFTADNYGYWLLHCHIDFHSEVGMMMVFKTSKLPKQRKRSCLPFA